MSCVGRWSWRWEALCIVCKWLLLSSSLCLAGVYLSAGGGIGSESLNHPRCLLSITTKKKKDHLIPHFTHRWCFFFGQLSAASCYKSLGISSYCVGGKPCIISDWWLAPLTPPTRGSRWPQTASLCWFHSRSSECLCKPPACSQS